MNGNIEIMKTEILIHDNKQNYTDSDDYVWNNYVLSQRKVVLSWVLLKNELRFKEEVWQCNGKLKDTINENSYKQTIIRNR